MNVKEAIINRKSIRKFKAEPISEEQMNILKKSIQFAPSASNRQPYRFILVKDRILLKTLRKKAIYQRFIDNAPIFIVGLGYPEGNPYYKLDVAIALQHVALQAVEIGLGTCWIGAFDEQKAKKILKIPEEEACEIIACMAVGIPDQNPPARPRKSYDELFIENYFEH